MAMNTLREHAAARRRKKYSYKRAQSMVPMKFIDDDGIFKADGLYVKTYNFSNINFKLLSQEMEKSALRKWGETLNTFEPGVAYKYVIMKKEIDLKEYMDARMLPSRKDGLDEYRHEYNKMQMYKLTATSLLEEARYLQVTKQFSKKDKAKAFYDRIDIELERGFRIVGSDIAPTDPADLLRSIYSFYHMNSTKDPETGQNFFGKVSLAELVDKKHTVKDFLAPYYYESDYKEDYVKIGGKYFRTLYIPRSGYGKYIKDTILDKLIDELKKPMCISVDLLPLERVEGQELVETLEFKNEINISKFTDRQNKNGNYNAQIPYKTRKKAEQIEEYNNDINERDQRIILSHITILHVADSLEELNADTESLKAQARAEGCELVELKLQQEDGIITALPFGLNRFVDKTGTRLRTLTTEGVSSFIPFTVKDVSHPEGIYYGVNRYSKRPIYINRKSRMNGNAIFFGSSGSGKSVKIKEELIYTLLNTSDQVILIDPEQEYIHLTKAMGGQVVSLAPNAGDFINAMEISAAYDEKDPIVLKSEMLLTLYGMAAGTDDINSLEKSILDRCIRNVYKELSNSGFRSVQPTLKDLRNELLRQPEPLARDIALTFEIYTDGSLNLFSERTNVDMSNRIICFDISEVGENLMPIAMLIVTDFITNTLAKNRLSNKWTHVIIDELYLMFRKEYTAIFFHKLWKRIRKLGGLCTGLTQEFSDILNSREARTLLSNSDFIVMLSASPDDSIVIQELMHLDETQMDYVTDVGVGNGMIKLGKDFIPFTDEFPEDTKLFNLISTKFSGNGTA